jgi:hypothetical protein
MFVLLSPALLAAVLALLSRRSLASLTRLRIDWWPLGLTAFATELALTSTPLGRSEWSLTWGSTVWVGALVVIAVVLGRNAWAAGGAGRWGWTLATLGVAANVLVVVANDGHMPQDQAARALAGASIERVAGLASEPGWHNVAPMTGDSRLRWLGDVLPEPAWLPLHNVLSVGDLGLGLGLAIIVFFATEAAPNRRTALAAA